MSNTSLTASQEAILATAIRQSNGRIEWFPDNIKGGARKKVLEGLFNRALITPDGKGWRVAAEGYDALGEPRPGVNPKRRSKFEAKLDQIIANAEDTPTAPPEPQDAELEAAVASAEAGFAQDATPRAPRTRENSKQAEVIRMLQRPEGATIRQICDLTGWQHTVRGTFAGAFRKKLGLNVTSAKEQGAERVYRIA